MKAFERSLKALTTLENVLVSARNSFEEEKSKAIKLLREPTQKIGELREIFTATEAQAKQTFSETVKEDFASVRENIRSVVTAAPPADFGVTLEAIKAAGKSISSAEASMYLEKYKGNYIAFRSLHEAITQAGVKLDSYVLYPDGILEEMSQGEQMILNTGREYRPGSSSYMMALLQSDKNPILALSEKVEKFLDGRYSLENEE